MNREEFLSAVEARLAGLSGADIEKSLDYYREMIDDRIEDGMSEQEAVAAMGTPEEAARQILEDTPLPKLVKARLRPQRTLQIWEIVLLVLGSPVWLPLVLTATVLVLTVYILLLAALLIFYSLVFSCCLYGVLSVPAFMVSCTTGRPIHGMLVLGSGLVFAGIAVLLFKPSVAAARGTAAVAKAATRGIKRMFIRKGETV